MSREKKKSVAREIEERGPASNKRFESMLKYVPSVSTSPNSTSRRASEQQEEGWKMDSVES